MRGEVYRRLHPFGRIPCSNMVTSKQTGRKVVSTVAHVPLHEIAAAITAARTSGLGQQWEQETVVMGWGAPS
jgi:hypothetical protein